MPVRVRMRVRVRERVCVYVCGKVGAWDGRSIGSVKPELQPPDVSVGG